MADSNSSSKTSSTSAIATVGTVVGTIIAILFHAGAAKLSYDRYGSIGWAILAFLFGSIYYPYYAFFVSGSTTTTMMGGLRRMKW